MSLPLVVACGIFFPWAPADETSRSAPQLSAWRCGPHYTSSQGLRCGSRRFVGSTMENPDPSLFMTVEEAAKRLGINGSGIQSLSAHGLIRVHRVFGKRKVIALFPYRVDIEAR